MRINVGCGKRVLPGWFNVDVVAHPEAPRPPELLSHANKITLEDGVADEVMAIHVFEHFYRWEAGDVLNEWFRLLRPGGVLTLEMPDLMKCCRNVLDGLQRGGKHADQLGMWGLYGDPREQQPYMTHRWGWTFATLRPFVEAHGFRKVREAKTQFHPAGRDARDFRLEAVKP